MAKNTRLAPNIELVEAWPAVYLKDIDAIVVADLHIGFELIRAERAGIAIPHVQGKHLLETLARIAKSQKASTLIVDGDIKHEFSQISYHEFKDVFDFLQAAGRHFKKIILIKGNHDNYIIRVAQKFPNIELHDELELGRYYFQHGHRPIDLKKIRASWIVIGHEHPAISMQDEIGVKEKVKAVLYGPLGRGLRARKNIIVLPAMSIFAKGVAANEMAREDFLTPILKKYGADRLKAVGIIEGEECLRFPEISRLR